MQIPPPPSPEDPNAVHGAPAGAGGAVPVEVELKLAVPPAACEALQQRLAALGPGRVLQVESVYYDTPTRSLAAQRAALRVRRVDDAAGPASPSWEQTLKTGAASAALTRRGEWETPVAGPRLEPDRLDGSPLSALLGEARPRLAPVFRTRFDRTVHEVQLDAARIEVAWDQGWVRAGRRREAICELELELHEGAAAAAFALALQLVGRGRDALALLPSVESKAARGYRLADRLPLAPQSAGAEGFSERLRPRMSCVEAAHGIVEHGMNRVLANLAGAAAGAHPEYVHQSRVALRRVRSALRLLRVATGDGDPVARKLRWLADRYGSLRDWDVLLDDCLPALGEATGLDGDGEWARLMERARRRRARRQQQLQQVLDSARFARTALQLLQWAHGPLEGPAVVLESMAAGALERGHRRLLAAGQGLAQRSAAARHRLRILAKRQRYALELLAPVVCEAAPTRTLRHLARLQQVLGVINDVQVAVSMLPSLAASDELRERAGQWAERRTRRQLPKAADLLERLQRHGWVA